MEENVNLRAGLGEWMTFLAPIIAPVERYTWTGSDTEHFWDILKRGVIKRQYEAINAILYMVDGGYGHFGVTLLRPAYEELIWIEYLDQNAAVAQELVVLIAQHELAENLAAQNEYIGAKGMQSIGFTQRYVKLVLARQRESAARLREIGRQLGWREGQAVPSIAFMSRKVNREREYRFLYQGTSRYTHFSMQEIFRRAWGRKGEVTIGSSTFARYWQDFAMFWSFRILIDLLIQCNDVLSKDDIPDERATEIIEWVKSFTPIPILTMEELESWNQPRPPRAASGR